jgi:F-type H+-transporting ATPase subunit b
LIQLVPQFAESSGGISSLGVNLKGFLFQLLTFIIVLLILRRYVFPKLVETLESRRKALEDSLTQARATEEALAKAEEKAAELLNDARKQADVAVADAHKAAEEIIQKAEGEGSDRAARIVRDAEDHLEQERQRLHNALRTELADLVVQATEKVISHKLDAKSDSELIEKSIKELAHD